MKIKKPLVLITLIIWAGIAVSAAGLMVYGMSGGFSGRLFFAEAELIKTEHIPLAGADTIALEVTSYTLILRATDGDTLNVYQYGDRDADERNLFRVSVSGGRIRVYLEPRMEFRVGIGGTVNRRLVVEIPAAFAGSLDARSTSGGIRLEDAFTLGDVTLRSTSGGIRVAHALNAAALSVNTSSGGITIDGELDIAERLDLRSTSGTIRLNAPAAAGTISANTSSGGIRAYGELNIRDSLTLKSTSGGIRTGRAVSAAGIDARTSSGGFDLAALNVGEYNIVSTSGSIRIESITGGGRVNTSSGGIRLALREPSGEVRLESTSGAINITLDPALQFTFDASTSSGRIVTGFPSDTNERANKASAALGANPSVAIYAKASSGGIRAGY
jgi:DUF4097 and DUF4098 domain-containing protein YvlB